MNSVLVYTENYAPGGGNRYMIDTVNSIYGQFNEVVLASNPGGIYANDLKRLKADPKMVQLPIMTHARILKSSQSKSQLLGLVVNALSISLEPLLFVYNVALFIAFIMKIRPVLAVGSNGGYPAGLSTLAMIIAARVCCVPSLLSIVSVPSQRKQVFPGIGKLLDHMVWRCTSIVVVNASEITEKLVLWRGMPREKAHLVYNGLDEHIVPVKKPVEFVDITTIGLLARLDFAKGVEYLVNAYMDVHQKHPGTHLILAGDGDAYNYIVERLNRCGLQNSVSMLGYYDGDVQNLLASFDIYAFPSLHEGFPYSILEAMRSGCAIVATSVGGIPEAIRNNQEGLLVNPGSSEEIANAIMQLIINEPLRKQLGQQARERFLKSFTLREMEIRLEAIVKTCLSCDD